MCPVLPLDLACINQAQVCFIDQCGRLQGMAGTLMLGAAFTLLIGWNGLSFALHVFIAVAFAALLFGKFCVGAFIYHYLTSKCY